MGYYTSFNLTYNEKGTPFTAAEIDDEIEKMNVFESFGGTEWWVSAKWYKHQTDMAFLSMKFPGVLFTLYGDGEDSEDFWYEYYKNGRMQQCIAQIFYEEYDENKLRQIVDLSEEEKSEFKYSYA